MNLPSSPIMEQKPPDCNVAISRELLLETLTVLKKYQARYHGVAHAQKLWDRGNALHKSLTSLLSPLRLNASFMESDVGSCIRIGPKRFIVAAVLSPHEVSFRPMNWKDWFRLAWQNRL